jgi:ferredoxin
VVFEELEECVKNVVDECPAKVIHISPNAMGFDPV